MEKLLKRTRAVRLNQRYPINTSADIYLQSYTQIFLTHTFLLKLFKTFFYWLKKILKNNLMRQGPWPDINDLHEIFLKFLVSTINSQKPTKLKILKVL